MARAKKARTQGPVAGGRHGKGRKMHTFLKLSTTTTSKNSSTIPSKQVTSNGSNQAGKHSSQQQRQQQQRPIIPFGRKDHILLIGEGDFSFARSLVVHHRCRNVLATCYDSKEILCSKYPQAEHTVREIVDAFPEQNKHDADALKNDGQSGQEILREARARVIRNTIVTNGMERGARSDVQRRHGPNVLFSVDARKLGFAAGGGKEVRLGFPRRERKLPGWLKMKKKDSLSSTPKGGPWDIICFNFPHVGGLSTDVNRQVRANQELLVAFFEACVPLLSAHSQVDDEDEWEYSTDDRSDLDEDALLGDAQFPAKSEVRSESGQILVTLFEGEPYTLWNIRDLARHAGLRVVTSFKFPWASYKGYSHARTLGDVEGKHGGRGGWRGEDREARTYVFEVKQEDHAVRMGSSTTHKKDIGTRRKRLKGASDSEGSD
ncbi:hypothetical protein EYZ11_006794 [Aspergillus tanneri]|uniref:25S rRNA (uridine-N(3))-methyltransferase BMT5-like domain-containing protein n=1 Tax=Aspergillus tanneri TaxID=1220188 RepID=A0A4S3JH01_9EURO|nr:uncharacterized protein ATNIH1004_009914 [Aspergillus tanneri]KAA8643152.1 hypothetical protein ATNIH1004_009914 [Aspergillus tanneri]THC93718.1 hypothetical protein EYZ11_006794 [Aspergillus tanneri]